MYKAALGSASKCFNPRARVGRDLADRLDDATDNVSIHAPAWGATTPTPPTALGPRGFNPRARVGRDKASATHAGG